MSEAMKSIMEMKTPITNRIDICLEDCKDDTMRMNLIKLRKTEIIGKLGVVIRGNRMMVECPPYSYSIPFDSLEAKEVLNFLMGEEKDNMSPDKESLKALKVVGGKILKDIEVSDEEFKGQAEFTGGADKASCPLVELLKDKEAMKELAFIFADAYFDTKHERFNNCGLKRDKPVVNQDVFDSKIELTGEKDKGIRAIKDILGAFDFIAYSMACELRSLEKFIDDGRANKTLKSAIFQCNRIMEILEATHYKDEYIRNLRK